MPKIVHLFLSQLANEIAHKEAERSEMERVRMELVLEEQEERERMKEAADIERQMRQKIEMQMTHAQQMHYKTLRMEAEKEEEDTFRKQVTNGLPLRALYRPLSKI